MMKERGDRVVCEKKIIRWIDFSGRVLFVNGLVWVVYYWLVSIDCLGVNMVVGILIIFYYFLKVLKKI